MKSFFPNQLSQEDLQHRLAQRRARNIPGRTQSMSQINEDTMELTDTMGDTLDDIMQNNMEIQRRQSLPRGYSPQNMDQRSSMMEFGSNTGPLNGFQFGTPTSSAADPNIRRQSVGELDLTRFADIPPGMNLTPQQMGFSPMQPQNALTINTNNQFSNISGDMMQNMMGYTSMGIGHVSEEETVDLNMNMNMFSPASYQNPYGGGNLESMQNDFMMPSNDGLPSQASGMRSSDSTGIEAMQTMPNLNLSEASMGNSPHNSGMNQNMASFSSTPAASLPTVQSTRESSYSIAAPTPSASAPDTEAAIKTEPKYHGIYSSSGFDMLGALMKVATRKQPEIEIGKVDMSCAFVVCDITQYDCPIIYISDVFERLTGYSKHEVKGQNCRFLQSPEGKVEAGTKREFTENESVHYLRTRIAEKKEAQRSLVNYRKGGQPFINLLTMIPITGEDDKTIKYYVGFQVDLVAKPTSLEGQNAAGMYHVDYSQSHLPRYVWQPPEGVRPSDGGQTISRDDVSTVLSSMGTSTESELTKRMWDKMLLENTDDVVHVLSLKGLFLYLSPSSLKVLEYDSSELVGTALSSVCHPSDIVPVTRELKDTSTGAVVSVVFRIRRKKSGYTWFESHGCLCVEQGKGRKCIILVGRERPVYAIHRHDIEAAGGLGESEMWTKLSTSGMFLFVSSNVRTLLDRAPDDLVGTSIQALMRTESVVEFGRSLEKARTGQRVTHKHEILNRKGLVLQAQTTLYPGDAAEGQKPTFLVAQTRLLKSSSRAVVPALSSASSMVSKGRIDTTLEDSTSMGHPPGLSSVHGQELSTPRSSESAPGIQSGQIGSGPISQAGGPGLLIGSQDVALASEDNIFDELKTTRCTSWQFELRQMEKSNRLLSEELAALLSSKKKRKRRKGTGNLQRDCANCHTRVTPEWRRGPSGKRDLCNSCGLRWAKQTGRVSPRTSTRGGDPGSKASQRSNSPIHSSPLQQEVSQTQSMSNTPDLNADMDMKGNMKGDGTAVPGSLGGRVTMQSMPVHNPSNGFCEGGDRRIINGEEG